MFFWKIFLFRTAVNLIFSTVPYELKQLYLNFSNVTTKDKYFPYFFPQSCKYCNFNTKKTVPRSRHSCTSSIKGLVNCMSHGRRDGAVIMSDWSDQSDDVTGPPPAFALCARYKNFKNIIFFALRQGNTENLRNYEIFCGYFLNSS